MPAKPAVEPEPDPVPLDTPVPADTAPPADDGPPPGRLAAGTYAYTGTAEAVYLEVPLTARPAAAGRPATVFHWPAGAPDDGRWQPTRSKPNQRPDNDPAPAEEE